MSEAASLIMVQSWPLGSQTAVKKKSSFKISYFKKNLLNAMGVLGYLAKLKRGLELAFCAHLLHDFSMKMFCI